MEDFTLASTSRNSADIEEDIVIHETATTRRVMRAKIVRKTDADPHVKIKLVHQRKRRSDEWEDFSERSLSSLRAGEEVTLDFDSEQTLNLIGGLRKVLAIKNKFGLPTGTTALVVGEKGRVVEVEDEQHAEVIAQLVSKGLGVAFWDHLLESKPDEARQLAYGQIQKDREAALAVFKQHLNLQDWTEPQWEDFLDENQWILGYGITYRILGIVRRQANYGGADFTRAGEQKGEFLTASRGHHRFTAIVEIKRPDTEIFDGAKYRNGVPTFSSEFIHGISQVLVNTHTWDKEGSRRDHDREKLAAAHTHTISPKAILIIGNSRELKDLDQRNAFELFRANAHNPTILTFDELFERAECIVTDSKEHRARQ